MCRMQGSEIILSWQNKFFFFFFWYVHLCVGLGCWPAGWQAYLHCLRYCMWTLKLMVFLNVCETVTGNCKWTGSQSEKTEVKKWRGTSQDGYNIKCPVCSVVQFFLPLTAVWGFERFSQKSVCQLGCYFLLGVSCLFNSIKC